MALFKEINFIQLAFIQPTHLDPDQDQWVHFEFIDIYPLD